MQMPSRVLPVVLTIAAFTALAAASGCKGYSTPSSPSSSSSSSSSTTPVQTTTVTIGPTGVSPSSIQIAVGQSVTFVNNGSRAYAISSDPHPTHTECPALNQMGAIPVGASRQTGAFTTARTCGFHDHDAPSDASLQGQIRIQ